MCQDFGVQFSGNVGFMDEEGLTWVKLLKCNEKALNRLQILGVFWFNLQFT